LLPNTARAKALSARIDAVETAIQKGKLKLADRIITNLGGRIAHKKFKKLSDDDKQQIVDLIDQFIAQFE
jgi:hypothetical protein